MSEFLRLFQERKGDYLGASISRGEFLRQILYFVEDNINTLRNDLPPELISIINRYSLGLSKTTYNERRWVRFVEEFIHFYGYENFYEDYYKIYGLFYLIFEIKYLENQRFEVLVDFEIDFCKAYKSIYSGGGREPEESSSGKRNSYIFHKRSISK